MMTDLLAWREEFEIAYGQRARIFSAPGRVNLIGEHTDYNEGFVLPIAIDRRTFLAAIRRNDRKVSVRSGDLNEEASFSLDDAREIGTPHWLAYIEGVARVLNEMPGVQLCGADMNICSDVPLGAGLSSSAALEIVTGLALCMLSESEIGPRELAVTGQKAERVYAGTNCGVMDQLAAVFGQEEHALLIDCRTLEIKPIELNIPHHSIVVCNTNVNHELASSAYNERRAECELGVRLLRQMLPDIRSLRDVTIAQFEQCKDVLPAAIAHRCRHVLTENHRTLRAAAALSEGDTGEFGRLMVQSHHSLRDDFEVSCTELDAMFQIALSHEAVAGARMTGGGFGGCTVNLVRRDAVESFRKFVEKSYERQTGITAATYVVEADLGAHEMTPQPTR